MTTAPRRAIAFWLLTVCALIFIMVVLGGVTRLTRSGLSIVEWQPITGAIPPLTETQWLEIFAKYRETPEYQSVNAGMDLAGFKGIFWLEYFHRLLGRLIGLAFLLPFLYFMARKQIERALAPKLWLLFALGAAQGLLGWLMVKSGLVDVPRVSPYRLSAHLSLAILIYGGVLWVALGLLYPTTARDGGRSGLLQRMRLHSLGITPSMEGRSAGNAGAAFRQSQAADTVAPLRRFGLVVTGLIFLMIVSGGFVAGTHAGFVFNDWPFMHGRLVPEGLLALEPWWRNGFENLATVQFSHRLLAYLLCLTIPAYWLAARRHALDARARLLIHLLPAVLAVQVTLGITTLLFVVPIPLAAAHQTGAVVLFTLALLLNHRLRSNPAQS